jgi:hypothetical protein
MEVAAAGGGSRQEGRVAGIGAHQYSTVTSCPFFA